MAEVMQRYAIGDLSRDLPDYPGEKGALTRTLSAVKQSLMAINAQIDELARAARAGDFSMRGDAAAFQPASPMSPTCCARARMAT
ncbi:hypothetical protein G6F54_014235 [Rhizopus delemar]|nr:hypothetical protein G6F54_014235 [Rhizopus delemar]